MELLVVIMILLVLSVLTLTLVNVSLEQDRIRGAARQLQSYLEGARDRAIYAREPRGVRFLLDPNGPTDASGNPISVQSMVFVGAPARYTSGQVTIGSGNTITPTTSAQWDDLYARDLLVSGTRIRIPQGTGQWYTMRRTSGTGTWYLTKDYTGPPGFQDYVVELAPAVLPNQEPRLLPRGIVIDLDNSILPGIWGSSAPYSNRMDVMFSPRGMITGQVAAAGIIHFVLSDAVDVEMNVPLTAPTWTEDTDYTAGQWVAHPTNGSYYQCTAGGTSGSDPSVFVTQRGASVTDGSATWECFPRNDSLIVTLVTQTGNISSHTVHPTDPNPFRYAETGEVAK